MSNLEARPALTFFFPYHEVSGVPMLFSRMAVHLAGMGMDVRVVDYPDGAMAERLRGAAGVRLIPFADGAPLAISDDSLLVMQSILPATIRPELRIALTTRLLFWTLHPANFVQAVIPLAFFRNLQMHSPYLHDVAMATVMRGFATRLRGFVTELGRRHALLFMDGENYRVTCERLHLEIPHPVFVPVPSDAVVTNRAEESPRIGDGSVSFGWLGRLADFKIHILVYTLDRLSRIARERHLRVRCHIIGDGADASLIRRKELEHEHFEVKMLGVLKGPALDDYLVEELDVLAAMGTSALEGARLGLPTILLDACYGAVSGDYLFRWLHDTKEYNLGELIGPRHFAAGNDSLERMIGEIMSDGQGLSRRAFAYYRDNHAIGSVADRFLEAACRSRFTYGDIDPELLKKGAIRRTYEWMRACSARTGQGSMAGKRPC